MAKNDKMEMDNSGVNQGVMVWNNQGNIQLTLSETKKIPSLISMIVKSLGENCSDENMPDSSEALTVYKPDEKIEYNCVFRYKYVIKEYSAYFTYCGNVLDIYDNSNVGSKARILRCIHMWYLEEKGNLISSLKDADKEEIEIIRENSDYLIDRVKERILNVINRSDISGTYIEDIETGVAYFVCYCFIECKILEKPV